MICVSLARTRDAISSFLLRNTSEGTLSTWALQDISEDADEEDEEEGGPRKRAKYADDEEEDDE